MADLDLSTIPFVPSTDVALIDPATGRPKQAMHDYMFAQSSWMSQNVVDLKTKVTTLTDQVGSNSAAITNEQTARVNADNALSSSITSLTATFNGFSASGQIYFAAMAAPGGSTAAYGIFLTAGNYYAGLQILATSGGGSAIGFTASQFFFTDSGTAQQVLAYDGSSFVFQVPIIIRSGTTGERTVQTPQNTKIYDGAGTLRVALGINI